MRARFFCLGLLAGVLAILVQCVVANALMITQTQTFDLDAPQATFQVINARDPNPPNAQIITVTNNSPQSPSPQTLTFNKFNPALGNLTGVTITLTSDYDVTVAVTATNKTEASFAAVTFFAETKTPFGQKLTGSLISDLLPTTIPTFSASCSIIVIGGTCNSGPQSTNNNDFSAPASLAVPFSSFSGAGTFDLFAAMSSALAPRVEPDNGTNFADNSTFTGTLTHGWDGNVTVVYTYDPFATPVPEPLSLYLLAAGLGGIVVSRRRRP